MNTLYLSDLDGTLLDERARLSPLTIRTIGLLQARGVLFSYATARSRSTAVQVTAGLAIDLPAIVYNGAMIVHSASGEPICSERFTPAQAAQIRQAIERFGLPVLVYAWLEGRERVSWLVGEENDGLRHYLAARAGDPRLRPVHSAEALFAGVPFYFTTIGEGELLAPLYEELEATGQYQCLLQRELYRAEYWCETMPRQATKAAAALRLKALLGCQRVVAFGDSLNDLPLFAVADESYAVANAVPALQAAATGIIGSNRQDGVARWLQEHLL